MTYMNTPLIAHKKRKMTPYLTVPGAWALAFGCAVGWGAFVMPGGTFLPIAGPVGSAVGLGLGAVIMLIIAVNYHYLMNRYPDAGGTYTYTKHCFGYDNGFLSAWFLILTYVAIIWANASALPLIGRTLLGSTFQFGFHYVIAGFHIYFGEILLAVSSLVIAALLCLRRRTAGNTQTVMAVMLFGGVVVCFAAAMGRTNAPALFEPAYSPENSPLGGLFTIFALAPWAYVGFESITHSAGEAKFSLRKSFGIMAAALVTAGIAYALLAMLGTTFLPEGCGSWVEYIRNLGNYDGPVSQPTFFAAHSALGTAGSVLLGTAALCGIFTGLIGNYVALSRLLWSLAQDGLFPGWFGELDEQDVPRNAVLVILGVSVFLPFLGRTAISWIVDVTTVGATIAYTFASACAWKAAREEKKTAYTVSGIAGMVVSFLFAVEFLVPNIISIKTLSMESYLILAAWGILGFIVFRSLLINDREKRLGRSIIPWMILLGLIIFTSTVWMLQSVDSALNETIIPIREYCTETIGDSSLRADPAAAEAMDTGLKKILSSVDQSLSRSIAVQTLCILFSLLILLDIYSRTQKRERQTEIEKAIAEDASRAKTSFLSNMSHEIRTPMNAIIGLDTIALRNPNLQPQTREQLEKIGSSARHLLGLINDILDMSRIESGRMVLKNEEFSFREFMDQINIMINGQCVDKGLHYECSVIGHVRDYYRGDDLKLKQVIINILGNSVKFTNAPGTVTLTVEDLGGTDGNTTLRFTMADTGIGMDQAFIPKIFEAFSQEDATVTNRYGGSGLGMAITKNFVEMMGGSIRVESEKGVGSTFTVTVVLGTSDRSFRLDHDLPKDIRAAVIDDDEVSCEHAMAVLKTVGIEADTFTHPDDALRSIREAFDRGDAYRLVLTDFKMPEMTGLDLIREVRSFDGGKTAIIMLTGYNWDIIEDEALSKGVDSIMAKPLFTDSLTREIQSIFARQEGEKASVEQEPDEASVPETSLAGRRILMAEDVEQNAEILEDLLDLEDIEHEYAENGAAAVKMFTESPAGYFDAVLMDVRMPVMDGLAAARAIRGSNHPDAKSVPIIAMTANVFDEDVQRSLEAGMNAHLSKPIEPDKLYAVMAGLIAEREAER